MTSTLPQTPGWCRPGRPGRPVWDVVAEDETRNGRTVPGHPQHPARRQDHPTRRQNPPPLGEAGTAAGRRVSSAPPAA